MTASAGGRPGGIGAGGTPAGGAGSGGGGDPSAGPGLEDGGWAAPLGGPETADSTKALSRKPIAPARPTTRLAGC